MSERARQDDQPHDARTAPRAWSRQTDAWRWSRRLSRRRIDTILRARSAKVLPPAMRARIDAMGLPADIVDETLREIRSLEAWPNAWIETAQRFLGDYRRQISGSQRLDAAHARMLAGYCYHIAQLAPGPDERTLEHCRATAATLVRQALPDVMPQARRLDVPWRSTTLPAILLPGPDREEPSGLVVMLNGTSTTKEELLRWTTAFTQAGQAVLLLDTPGTGEARHLGPPAADQFDVLDGVFDLLRSYHAIDLRKVGIVGISLGGNLALRCLAYDRRIAGAVLVTPPYEPGRWVGRAAPMVQAELQQLFQTDDPEAVRQIAASYDLADVVGHVQRPTLILGGARDVIVPPAESTRLAAALGELSTLAWYPTGGHALYQELPAWTLDASAWLHAVQQRQSTRVDDQRELAASWRAALEEAPLPEPEWDEEMESARLLSPEETASARPRRPLRVEAEPRVAVEEGSAEDDTEGFDDAYSRAFGGGTGRSRVPRRRPAQRPPDEMDL